MTKHNLCSLALVITVLFLLPQNMVCAQDATPRITSKPVGDDFQAITDEEIQMMRKDIRSQRKQIIAANMKLTALEAEKFWPTYDQYVNELVKINDAKYALVKEYLQSTNMTEEQADSLSRRWLDVDESVVQLRLKYIPIFRKALSARGTALFFQIDRRVQMMIDLQLASSLPLVEP